MVTRRSFLTGLGVMLAAPAVVRSTSLMPIIGWDHGVDDQTVISFHQVPAAADLNLLADAIRAEVIEKYGRLFDNMLIERVTGRSATEVLLRWDEKRALLGFK